MVSLLIITKQNICNKRNLNFFSYTVFASSKELPFQHQLLLTTGEGTESAEWFIIPKISPVLSRLLPPHFLLVHIKNAGFAIKVREQPGISMKDHY